MDRRRERRLYYGGDRMQNVAKIVRAIGGATNRNRTGQCTLSTWQTRGGLGEGLGNHVTISSELFSEFELDGTVMEIGQEEMSVQYLLRNLR
jgi:hypothetical protein